MSTAQGTSVRHEIVVDAPIERAFRVFTEQFDRIKPREHNLLAVDISETGLRAVRRRPRLRPRHRRQRVPLGPRSPDGPDRTRVQLEHRHLDRHGPGWESTRDGVTGDAGWPLYLQRYDDLID